MEIELTGHDTRIWLLDEPWNRGIRRLVVGGNTEIPFLLPALSGHHFFTGEWPAPPDAVAYEPHSSPGSVTRVSQTSALWHQPATPKTRVETQIEYEIVGPGAVEARFTTRSHAATYPHGYVGLFWGTVIPHGGQRGMHLVVPTPDGELRWHYFQGGGDSMTPRANTVLGPGMPSAPRSPGHPPTYLLAESPLRFALPIHVGRWRDLYYALEVNTPHVAFTDVLLGTAIGGPSWDVMWRLAPGETRSLTCRLTVGRWAGWEAIEERYRAWCELWRHWTAYVPPDVHRALVARSLFRVWNAGPEYNLKRAHARGDRLAFDLCLARFIEEVLELTFCWNERFVPPYKSRLAQFRRLPICPAAVRESVEALADRGDAKTALEAAGRVSHSVKLLMKDLYHLPVEPRQPLATFAHAIRVQIEDDEVRRHTPLEW